MFKNFGQREECFLSGIKNLCGLVFNLKLFEFLKELIIIDIFLLV